MTIQQKMNTRFSSLRKALRQLGYAALATLPMLGSVQAATDEFVYFHTDALGSPTAAFNEAGEVCWVETYSPYGEKQDKEDSLAPATGCGLLGTDVGYTGHVQDGSGLVYAQQRYYDPVVGRFMSTDPTKPSAGDPRYFGRYQYGGNNPYKYTDPDGEDFDMSDEEFAETFETLATEGSDDFENPDIIKSATREEMRVYNERKKNLQDAGLALAGAKLAVDGAPIVASILVVEGVRKLAMASGALSSDPLTTIIGGTGLTEEQAVEATRAADLTLGVLGGTRAVYGVVERSLKTVGSGAAGVASFGSIDGFVDAFSVGVSVQRNRAAFRE